jgi:hypothetical protein
MHCLYFLLFNLSRARPSCLPGCKPIGAPPSPHCRFCCLFSPLGNPSLPPTPLPSPSSFLQLLPYPLTHSCLWLCWSTPPLPCPTPLHFSTPTSTSSLPPSCACVLGACASHAQQAPRTMTADAAAETLLVVSLVRLLGHHAVLMHTPPLVDRPSGCVLLFIVAILAPLPLFMSR